MIELSNDTVTRQMSEDIIAAASTSSTPSWPNAHCIVNTTQLSVLHKGVPHGIANAAGQLSMSDLLNRRFTARDRFCHVDNMVAAPLLLHLSGASTTASPCSISSRRRRRPRARCRGAPSRSQSSCPTQRGCRTRRRTDSWCSSSRRTRTSGMESGASFLCCVLGTDGHAWTWRGVKDWAPWLELPKMAARDLLIA